jgi:hypothetical protein
MLVSAVLFFMNFYLYLGQFLNHEADGICDHNKFSPSELKYFYSTLKKTSRRMLQQFEDGDNFNEEDTNALQSNSKQFKPIRIKAVHLKSEYYNKTKNPNIKYNISDIDQILVEKFENNILNPAIKLYQELLQVYPMQEKIYLNKSPACPYVTPPELEEGISDSDLIILYFFQYDSQVFRARSQPCQLFSKYYNRPIVGLFYFNLNYYDPAYFQPDPTNKFKIFEFNYRTVVHEFAHIFGFSPMLYNFYVDQYGKSISAHNIPKKSKNTNSTNVTTETSEPIRPFIITRQVKEYAQEYYNCPSLIGMPLEDNGLKETAGAHFSRDALYNELMTGSSIFDTRKITKFTLKLLESTGWYTINYTHRQIHIPLWGRGKGCGFIERDCSSYIEFCTKNNSFSCDYHHQFMSICTSDGLSKCNYNYGFQNCSDSFNGDPKYQALTAAINKKDNFHTFSQSSQCVLGSFNNGPDLPRCQVQQCDTSNKTITISLFDSLENQQKEIKCSEEDYGLRKNILLSGDNNITIICPNYTQSCWMRDEKMRVMTESKIKNTILTGHSSFVVSINIKVVLFILLMFML